MSFALSGFLSHCATIFPGKTLRWFNEITEKIFMDMIFIESLYNFFSRGGLQSVLHGVLISCSLSLK